MTSDGNAPGGGGFPFDLGALMGKAQEIQKRMVEQQAQAETIVASGKAGGGMVTATANGAGKVLRIEIEESLVQTGDKDMIEDLTVAAVNQALAQAQEQAKAEMAKAAGNMQMPFDISSLLG